MQISRAAIAYSWMRIRSFTISLSHVVFGTACRDLVERIEQGDLLGYTSTHILSEIAHRMMMIEAANLPGWGASNIKRRLQRQPQILANLTHFHAAIRAIASSKVHVIAPTTQSVLDATTISQQHGLLSNDALIVAVMQEHGLSKIASGDTDFDRVPGITRFGPV